MEPEGLWIEANGLRHRVWHWRREGPALVVVHGITNSARGWDFVCRELAADAYVVDLRGHGETDKPEHGYRTADYAADLAGVIGALGLERPAVLGHSLGARVSARLAAERPELVARLVLVDPPIEQRDPEASRKAMEGFLAGVRATRARGAAAVRDQYLDWSDEQVAARVLSHQQLSDRVLLDPIERFEATSLYDDLARIACPTLFLYGDTAHTGNRPGIVSHAAAQRALATLRDGELAFVPATGHMVPWDDLAGFLEPLRRFLGLTTS